MKMLTALLILTIILGLALMISPPVIPNVAGQEKAQEKKASGPRVHPLIGTWEGRLEVQRGSEGDRVLIIEEREGQLVARYGIPGKRLERVDLFVEFFEGSRPRMTFRTRAGNTISLSLIKEDWLSGVFVVGSPGLGFPERPMQLLRKKSSTKRAGE